LEVVRFVARERRRVRGERQRVGRVLDDGPDGIGVHREEVRGVQYVAKVWSLRVESHQTLKVQGKCTTTQGLIVPHIRTLPL